MLRRARDICSQHSFQHNATHNLPVRFRAPLVAPSLCHTGHARELVLHLHPASINRCPTIWTV
jgi:hypothetical protein